MTRLLLLLLTAGAQSHSEVRPTGPPPPPPPLTFPLQHTASSLYTCQPRPSRPCLRSSLALGTFRLKEKPVRWSPAGTLPGKKRGPVVRRWRGVRVFRRSSSAAGAPSSQTSERAASGRSGGRIYITHADAGKHDQAGRRFPFPQMFFSRGPPLPRRPHSLRPAAVT